jgi:MFS family permease
MMGLAASIGQFSGGALVEWSPFGLGWRTVFLVKLPIGIPVMLMAWWLVPETSANQRRRLDIAGAALVSLTLACLVLPLSEGRDQGWPTLTFVMLATAPFFAGGSLHELFAICEQVGAIRGTLTVGQKRLS